MLIQKTVLLCASAIGFLMAFMVLLSRRDTLREFRSLFDVRILTATLRSCTRFSTKMLLAFVLTICVVIAIYAPALRVANLNELFGMLPRLAYILAIVAPLLVVFYSDAFGSSPRERWARFTDAATKKSSIPASATHCADDTPVPTTKENSQCPPMPPSTPAAR